ncbi:MAG: YidC/Oxa1 family membrane protein insertase [Lachnospiraceae bacterium]|nr:YidC/Oxa1 family membrane protein insertase [Lachnospiraceae bacterium]
MNYMLLTQTTNVILRPFAFIMKVILQGIFWFLGLFMEYPNIGLAIILFTIIMYVLMLPLTIKQQKFSKLNNKMNPELQAIQAKYKGKSDQESMQKMQAETQAVYQKYGVSPSGSCIQLLIQMPILFALYRIVYNIPAYVDRVKEVFIPVVEPLSQKIGTDGFLEILQNMASYSRYANQVTSADFVAGSEAAQNTLIDLLNGASTQNWLDLADAFPELAVKIQNAQSSLEHFNNFLGLNIANSPSFVISTEFNGDRNWILIIGAMLVPFLSAMTQWVNTKLMPQPEQKRGEENAMMQSMKTMNTVMPLMSAFFCYTLPIGLGLYWITGSVVRSIIQVCVNKHLDKIDIDEMIKKNVEKNNEKRKKQGLPPQQISTNARINTRNVEISKEKEEENKARREKNVKASTEFYNKNADKPGSLASKAAMVKQFNEKNNKQ